jgi:hypothetical protein
MMKSVQIFISYLHEFSQVFSTFLSIFLVQKWKKSLTSGARLAVTWSPHVTPQLAAVGGVSCHARVWV